MPAQTQGESGPLTLFEREFRGLNLSASPAAMPDGYALKCQSFMPYAAGTLVLTPQGGPLATYTTVSFPSGVAQAGLWAVDSSTDIYLIAQGSDGSLWIKTSDEGWGEVSGAGTTTVGGLHAAMWQGPDAQGNPEAILFVDTAKGYFAFDKATSAVKTLNASMTGQAICLYAGRVWIAQGATVQFTAPGAYNDFTVADFGGSFSMAESCVTGPVRALFSANGFLYICGDGVELLNSVQIGAFSGSSTMQTSYYRQALSPTLSVPSSRSGTVVGNDLYLAAEDGVWSVAGMDMRQVAGALGDAFAGTVEVAAQKIFGRTCLVLSTGYCYDPVTQAWWEEPAIAAMDGLCWQPSGGAQAYAYNASGVQQLFSDYTSPVTGSLTTKLYSAENESMEKSLLKLGAEIWQTELVESPAAQPLPSLTLQALGFSRSSPVYTWPGAPGSTATRTSVPNLWIPFAASCVDRYFSIAATLKGLPGLALGAVAAQFKYGASWPPATPTGSP